MGISSAMGPQALIPSGFGFRNLIINGDFRLAQRGTSFTSTGTFNNNDDTYNLDRWTILSDGNDIVDITQATDVPTGGLYSIGLDVETANKKFGIIQFVEQQNITGVQNKNVWLSFKARTTGSSISNVKAVVLAWTGTADTVTSDVVSAWGADGVTPTWAANWTAENTPSNLGVTNSWAEYRVQALCDASNIKNLAVFIWCDDTSTTLGDFLYVTDVQLEINNSPTPFERRPIQTELHLCQRYCFRIDATANSYFIATSYFGGAGAYIHVDNAWRVAPTITFNSTSNWVYYDNPSADIALGNLTGNGISANAAYWGGSTDGQQSGILFRNTVGTFLVMTAEL